MLVEDEDTGAILLFLETFRDADRLADAARRAFEVGKPVIAYKLGRSGVGRRVANSHTGALTGPDEIANAFFREHGIIRVDTFEGALRDRTARHGASTATGQARLGCHRHGRCGGDGRRPAGRARVQTSSGLRRK